MLQFDEKDENKQQSPSPLYYANDLRPVKQHVPTTDEHEVAINSLYEHGYLKTT